MHATANYGDAAGDEYDTTYEGFVVSTTQLDLLARLADGGKALEVGVGTGRVAIPLARRGVQVTGVDPSELMLARLRAKDLDRTVTTWCGTLETMRDHRSIFSVVYAPFNVLFLLSREGAQANFFIDAGAILTRHGYVVVECFVPRPGIRLVDGANPAFFPQGRHVEVRSVTPERVSLLVSDNDQEQQVWQLNELIFRSDGSHRWVPSTIAYLVPEQIDTIAYEAGFELIERYSDWDGSAYNSDSRKHISVYKMKDSERL